jgi:hypothetical protein
VSRKKTAGGPIIGARKHELGCQKTPPTRNSDS